MAVMTKDCEEFEQELLKMTEPLARQADVNQPYNFGHSVRVASYAIAIAEELKLPLEEIKQIEIAAKLHDVGKIRIDRRISTKKGPLTKAEWQVLKEHPSISATMLRYNHFPEEIVALVLNHHERVDGKGYPNGKSGDAIPIGAKIISLADAFDAMTTGNTYREIKSSEEAKQELIDNSGTQFDSEVAKVFLKSFRNSLRSADSDKITVHSFS